MRLYDVTVTVPFYKRFIAAHMRCDRKSKIETLKPEVNNRHGFQQILASIFTPFFIYAVIYNNRTCTSNMYQIKRKFCQIKWIWERHIEWKIVLPSTSPCSAHASLSHNRIARNEHNVWICVRAHLQCLDIQAVNWDKSVSIILPLMNTSKTDTATRNDEKKKKKPRATSSIWAGCNGRIHDGARQFKLPILAANCCFLCASQHYFKRIKINRNAFGWEEPLRISNSGRSQLANFSCIL